MSYYPKQYPVLGKTRWRLDTRDEFKEGKFEDAILADNGPQVAPAKQRGTYLTPIIDAGQAVAWSQLAWEADLPLDSAISLRTRFGATRQECEAGRWSAKYTGSPATIVLAGSREVCPQVAAARYLQVRAEMRSGTGGTPTLRSITLDAALVAPACAGPMDRAVVAERRPVFHWTRVEGAESYVFEISTTPDFSHDVFRQERLADTHFVAPADLRPGAYYWRVCAVDGTGQHSGFSQTREFVAGERPRPDRSRLRHPYLLFAAEDIPRIKHHLIADQSAGFRALLERADEAFVAEMWDEKDVLLTPGQHGNFHSLTAHVARGQLEPLAFAYLFTGEHRYAACARELLLSLVAMSRWTGAPFGNPNSFYPVWQAALETAEICRSAAIAYDWLYGYLSDDDRATVREGLLRLGVLPLLQSWSDPKTTAWIPRHQVPSGNWWSVCNSGAGIGALALLDSLPDAQRWVEMAADAIRAYLCYRGGDIWNVDVKAGLGGQYLLRTYPNWGLDGGYIESLGYLDYGLSNALYFIDALKRVTGEDLSAHINPEAIDLPYYCSHKAPDGKAGILNFNDSGRENLSDDLYALLAVHQRSGKARFLLEESYPVRKNIAALIADVEVVEPELPDAALRNKLFSDIGWCVFRDGWAAESSLMAVKFRQGRGHQDIGQFVIHYKGRPFIIDPGVVSYADPIYAHLRTSHAHNLVLVNEQCQMPADGTVLGFAQVPGIGIARADLTAAYQDLIDSWVRTLVYMEPDCFLVVDQLTSGQERSFSWQIHPEGKVAVQPGLGATIHQDDYEMQLRLLAPHDWRVVTKRGYIGSAEADYLSFSPDAACTNITFAAVFAGTTRGRNIGVERQETRDCLCIRVITPEASHTALVHLQGSGPISGCDVSADAALCAVTHTKRSGEHRWVIAGRGPLIEKGTVLEAASESVEFRAGGG